MKRNNFEFESLFNPILLRPGQSIFCPTEVKSRTLCRSSLNLNRHLVQETEKMHLCLHLSDVSLEVFLSRHAIRCMTNKYVTQQHFEVVIAFYPRWAGSLCTTSLPNCGLNKFLMQLCEDSIAASWCRFSKGNYE